jgi:hypothetical protein
MPESVGFQYWRDSSMLLGVNSKHQEKMREDWENLKNENNFYVRKMKKMRKKMKELEEENKKLKEENEGLNEEVNDRVVIEDIADAFGSDEGDDFDWESEIGGMVLKNKELEQEIRELKCKYDAERLARAPRLWNELKEENKKLKDRLHWKDKEIRAYEKDALNSGQIALRQEEEIKDLKEEDYKSFGVMFVEKEDGDEDDIDFFDTEFEAQKLMNELISSNTTSSHPYPEGKLILFRSHKYNPDYDNSGTVPIVREMKIATSAVDNLDSLLGQLKKRTKFLEKTRK